MQKRGLSDVVTTVLIILLVIVAIAAIWAFVQRPVQQAGKQTEIASQTALVTVLPASIVVLTDDAGAQTVTLNVKRGAGEGTVKAVVLVLSDATGKSTTKRADIPGSLGELETKQVTVGPIAASEIGKVVGVAVAPVYALGSGQETTSTRPAAPIQIAAENYFTAPIVGNVVAPSSTTSIAPVTLSASTSSFKTNTEQTIEFYDGDTNNPANLIGSCTATNAPCSITWNGLHPFGSHALKAKARGVAANGVSFVAESAAGTSMTVTTHYLTFDGTNDYVKAIDNDAFDIGTGDFSISLWVKSPSGGLVAGKKLIAKKDTDSASVGWGIWTQGAVPNTAPTLKIIDPNGISCVASSISASIIPDDGQWHNIIFVVRRSGTSQGYLDGMQKSTATINPLCASTNINSPDPLIIGADVKSAGSSGSGDAAEYFKGSLDDIRIYKGALNLQSVSTLYGSGIGNGRRSNPTLTQPATLSAHFTLDDGSGTQATNSIAPPNGVLTNGPVWETDI